MTEELPAYGTSSEDVDLRPLAGRRIQGVYLAGAVNPRQAVCARLWFLLDDGTWFELMSNGDILPLPHKPRLDLHTLNRRGDNAYQVTAMAVASPDGNDMHIESRR
ncbi:MAG: hypothetical protein PVI37_11820 [Gammaproteobacteria bacterium]|jgi:hypothetical protein